MSRIDRIGGIVMAPHDFHGFHRRAEILSLVPALVLDNVDLAGRTCADLLRRQLGVAWIHKRLYRAQCGYGGLLLALDLRGLACS